MLQTIGNGSAVGVVSLNPRIAKAPPKTFGCAASEVIGINKQPVVMLWNLREAKTRDTAHFVCANPSQRPRLHPLNCVYPF
jgi:hypothetical protein